MRSQISGQSLAKSLEYAELVTRSAPALLQALKATKEPRPEQLIAVERLEALISAAQALKCSVARAKSASNQNYFR